MREYLREEEEKWNMKRRKRRWENMLEIFLYLKGKFINIMMSVKWMFHTFIACIQLFIAKSHSLLKEKKCVKKGILVCDFYALKKNS